MKQPWLHYLQPGLSDVSHETLWGCSYSFVNWEMLSVRPNRGMLTPSH